MNLSQSSERCYREIKRKKLLFPFLFKKSKSNQYKENKAE